MTANSAMMQVKYLAACRLAPPALTSEKPQDMGALLKHLDEEYRTVAPRLKSIRERVLEFETQPEAIASD